MAGVEMRTYALTKALGEMGANGALLLHPHRSPNKVRPRRTMVAPALIANG